MKQLIVIAIFALVIVAGYFLLPKPKNPTVTELRQVLPLASATVKPSPYGSSVPTNIYTNRRNKFTLQYPVDWQVESDKDDTTVFAQIVPPRLSPDEDPDTGKIFIVATPINETNAEVWLTLINSSTGLPNQNNYIIKDPVIVDGISAVVGEGGCCGFIGKHVLVVKNHKLYDIALIGPPNGPFENNVTFSNLARSIKLN